MQAHGPGADELCSRRVDRPGRCCMNGHRKPRHRVNHRHTMVWLRSARRPVAPARVVVSGLVMVCAVMICEVMHGVERNAAFSPVLPRCGVLNILRGSWLCNLAMAGVMFALICCSGSLRRGQRGWRGRVGLADFCFAGQPGASSTSPSPPI